MTRNGSNTVSTEILISVSPVGKFPTSWNKWPHRFLHLSIMSNVWSTSDARANLLHAESNIKKRVKSAWSGFIEFALRENVLAVAVGLMWVPTNCIYPRSIHKLLFKNRVCIDGSSQLSCFRYPSPTLFITAIYLQKHGRKVLGTQERSTLLGFKWLQYKEAGHRRWCCSDDLRVKSPIDG